MIWAVAKRGVSSFRTVEYERLIDVLREAREAAGLRHDELAKLLGKGRMFVYSLEHYGRRVDPEEVRQIGVALGVQPRELFDRWLERLDSPDCGPAVVGEAV